MLWPSVEWWKPIVPMSKLSILVRQTVSWNYIEGQRLQTRIRQISLSLFILMHCREVEWRVVSRPIPSVRAKGRERRLVCLRILRWLSVRTPSSCLRKTISRPIRVTIRILQRVTSCLNSSKTRTWRIAWSWLSICSVMCVRQQGVRIWVPSRITSLCCASRRCLAAWWNVALSPLETKSNS